MKADDALAGVDRLLLDTNTVVYVVESHPQFSKHAWGAIDQALMQGTQLVVSPLTLIEVLAKPGLTDEELKAYTQFCLGTQEIEFRSVLFDDLFAVRVGYFRRTGGVKTPDGVQFGCAERLHCDAILTNDRHYEGRAPCRVIIVEDVDP